MHRDYQGSVSYEDGRLVIQILHIDDFVTAECDSASDAPRVFAELVDDYLETCEALGKQPSRPFKGTFNVRISPELHRLAAVSAAEVGDSLNSWVQKAISQSVKRAQDRRDLHARVMTQEVVLGTLTRSFRKWEPRHPEVSMLAIEARRTGDLETLLGALDRPGPWQVGH
jgi:predicted HicB family RNase H-like nuclease